MAPHAEETKRKCSEAQRKRWARGSYDNRPPVTEETKVKIRQTLQQGVYSDCLVCGKEVYSSPSRILKYCSQKCNGSTRTGENNHKWNGGTSRAYKTGYYSQEYKNWRKAVFNRDNYICQDCGQSGGYLTAHHIKSFAKYPDLRFDIPNGRTLCEPCHSKTDNYKGKNKGTTLCVQH